MPQGDHFVILQAQAKRVTQRQKPGRFQRGSPSTPGAVRDVLRDLRLHLAEAGIDPVHLGSIELAMAEVLNNISRHAYGVASPGRISVSADLRGQGLHITVCDSGVAMPGGQMPPGCLPNIQTKQQDLPEGGFGWFLIRDLADSVHYTRDGGKNRLDLQFFCPQKTD